MLQKVGFHEIWQVSVGFYMKSAGYHISYENQPDFTCHLPDFVTKDHLSGTLAPMFMGYPLWDTGLPVLL